MTGHLFNKVINMSVHLNFEFYVASKYMLFTNDLPNSITQSFGSWFWDDNLIVEEINFDSDIDGSSQGIKVGDQ